VKLISQTAAAERLGLSTKRVRELDDELRPIRVEGGSRVYRADAVDAVVRERAAARKDK
jgi:hypothetical protein